MSDGTVYPDFDWHQRWKESQKRIAELEKKWAIVFDGYAVLNELTPSQRSSVSPEAVSAVLDSIARLAALEVKDAPEAPRIKTTWQADWERGKGYSK